MSSGRVGPGKNMTHLYDLMREEFGVEVMRVHELLEDVVDDPRRPGLYSGSQVGSE